MAAADLVILVILGLYGFFGLVQGYAVGLVRLASLVAMYLVLTVFADQLMAMFPQIRAISLNDDIAYAIVAGGAIVALKLGTGMVTTMLTALPSDFTDRLLGGFIGLCRASLMIVMGVIVTSMLPPGWTTTHWHQSQLLRFYGSVTEIALLVVPEGKPGDMQFQLNRLVFDEQTNQPLLLHRAPEEEVLEIEGQVRQKELAERIGDAVPNAGREGDVFDSEAMPALERIQQMIDGRPVESRPAQFADEETVQQLIQQIENQAGGEETPEVRRIIDQLRQNRELIIE